MTQIEVYADIVCPFAHVGLRRLVDERAHEHCDAHIRVRAWPLEWINGSPLDPAHVTREIDDLRAQVASDLFLGFDPHAFPRTSIPAFGLAAAGYARDDVTGEAVSLALRDAVFEQGLDVADPAVLDAVADRFCLERLSPRAIESAVRADWERGRARGVQGSPHFFAGDQSWFCPTLDIHKEQHHFRVRYSRSMDDFYTAALG